MVTPTKKVIEDELNTSINYDSMFAGSIKVYIPNFFTPNSDGVNEVFHVYTNPKNSLTLIKIEVSDDCSNILYQSVDIESYWNGFVDSKIISRGIYNYNITGNLTNSESLQRLGKFR